MKNLKLLQLLESVLGKGKPTSKNNIAFFSPFTSHYKPKLEININTTADGENPWHCWISDQKGRSIYTLFKRLNVSKDKFNQLSKLIDRYQYYTSHDQSEDKKEEILELPSDYKPLWIHKNSYEYKAAINYVKKRGLSIFDILRYRVGYAESGPYSGRIIIPSYNSDGKLNYFVSRIYRDKDTMKHKNPNVSKDIIGFELFVNWKEPLILCEAAFDAIAIKRNVIPLFGKFIQTELKKKIIQEHVKEVYICLDGDALKNSVHISEELMSEGINVYFVELSDKDPSDLGFEEIRELINRTEPMNFEKLMQYKMELLWK